jgi:hypothetical protein
VTPKKLEVSQIPANWADVSPSWMTDAIVREHPGANVSEVTVLTVDDGTNRRARIGLRYDAGSGPDVVFVKAEGAFREFHSRNGNMFNEADLFASGVPLPVDHPRPYKVIIDRPGLDYVIVMEDITARMADPRDATRPLTVDQVANGLRGLARLHSQFWGFSGAVLPELAWVKTWETSEGYLGSLRTSVPRGLRMAGSVLSGDARNHGGGGLVTLLGSLLETLGRGPLTLLHADPHIGNTYVLPDGDMGFLDWQVVRRGNWSHDVGYFLVSALTVEDRRSNDAELVEEYRKALLLDDDQRPTAQEAWLRYRATPAYGLPIWLATLNAESSQSHGVCLALCERYGAAFVELDAFGALAKLKV